jgi:hypothetical protein
MAVARLRLVSYYLRDSAYHRSISGNSSASQQELR